MKSFLSAAKLAKLALPLLCISALSTSAWAQTELKVTLAIPSDDAGMNGQGNEIELMTQAVIDDYNSSNPTLPAINLQIIDSSTTDAKTLQQEAADSIALLSCSSTTDCLTQGNIAKTLQIPLIGPMSGDTGMRDKANTYIFPVRPSNAEALQEALQAISGMRVKNLGVLVQNNYYGKSMDAELSALTLPKGLTISAKESIAANSNWEALSRKLQSAGVTAVLFLSDDMVTSSNLVQFWKSKRKTSAAYTPTLVHLNHLARPDYAEKSTATQPVRSSSPSCLALGPASAKYNATTNNWRKAAAFTAPITNLLRPLSTLLFWFMPSKAAKPRHPPN